MKRNAQFNPTFKTKLHAPEKHINDDLSMP